MGIFKVNRILSTYPDRLSEIRFYHKYTFIHHCDLCGVVETNPSYMKSYELEALMKNWEATKGNWGRETLYFEQRVSYHHFLFERIRNHHWATHNNQPLSDDFCEMYLWKNETEGKNRSKMIEIDTYIKRLEHYIQMYNVPEYKPYHREHEKKPASLC